MMFLHLLPRVTPVAIYIKAFQAYNL